MALDSFLGLDKRSITGYNEDNKAHPIVRAWISQLIQSKELALVLDRYEFRRIDVTLSASGGKAVLKPTISFR